MKNKIIALSMFLSISYYVVAQDTMKNAFAQSYVLEKSGNYTAAINMMKSVYSASSYEQNLRLGYLSYEAGQHGESMTYYMRAITLMPNAIEPKMGYVYPASVLGKWDEVVKQYQAILKIDPKNTGVNYKLGLIQYNRKNYPVAYKYFETVVTLYPFDYDGLLMFAWCNLQTGKTREAKALFQRVLLLSPDDKSAREGLAILK